MIGACAVFIPAIPSIGDAINCLVPFCLPIMPNAISISVSRRWRRHDDVYRCGNSVRVKRKAFSLTTSSHPLRAAANDVCVAKVRSLTCFAHSIESPKVPS